MSNVNVNDIIKLTSDQDNNWNDDQMKKSSISNKKNIALIAHIILLAAEMKNTIKVALMYITIERIKQTQKL